MCIRDRSKLTRLRQPGAERLRIGPELVGKDPEGIKTSETTEVAASTAVQQHHGNIRNNRARRGVPSANLPSPPTGADVDTGSKMASRIDCVPRGCVTICVIVLLPERTHKPQY